MTETKPGDLYRSYARREQKTVDESKLEDVRAVHAAAAARRTSLADRADRVARLIEPN